MLNRLYIVVGVVAILVLIAAFVAPVFIPWDMYRARFEEIATEVAGAPVAIAGDIRFELLPEPKLEFSGVTLGPADAPQVSVSHVAAKFSLMNFLTDRYTVTDLRLDGPRVSLGIDETGAVDARALGWPLGSADVAIAAATISDGAINFTDRRNRASYTAEGLSGTLKLDGGRAGGVTLQLSGNFLGARQGLSLAVGATDSDGAAPASLTLRNGETGTATTLTGTLEGSDRPKFTGTLDYRQPPLRDEGEAILATDGDLTATATVEITPERLLVKDFTLTPDENRAATRLTGAADVTLGTNMAFRAVLSGGLVTLGSGTAARQADLVRALRALPALPHLGMPGQVSIDVTSLGLGEVALSNLRADLVADAAGWTLKTFEADLPGSTTLNLSGRLDQSSNGDGFSGRVSLNSARLDLLSALWKPVAADTPLFNVPGGLEADLTLVGETLSLTAGQIRVGALTRGFVGKIGLGREPELSLSADFGTLAPDESAALVALVPLGDANPAFQGLLKKGDVTVSATGATIFGLPARGLRLVANWDAGVLGISEFSARDLGGVELGLKDMTLFGDLASPELSGSATIRADRADAPAVRAFHALNKVPESLVSALESAFPLRADLAFSPPNEKGAQDVAISGTAGATTVSVKAGLSAGFLRALTGDIALESTLDADGPEALAALFGVPDSALFAPGAAARAEARLKGRLDTGFDASLSLASGEERLALSGTLSGTSPDRLTGAGTVDAALSEGDGVLALLGAPGLAVPGFEGKANWSLAPGKPLALEAISGKAGEVTISGALLLTSLGDGRRVTGDLRLSHGDAAALLALVAGPAALTAGPVWPEGPVDLGSTARATSGRVGISVDQLGLLGKDRFADAHFDLDWDETGTRLRDFSAGLGTGRVTLDAALCCAGPVAEKQLTLRLGVSDVAAADLLPEALAAGLSGRISLDASLAGSGASPAALIGSLTGAGTWSVTGLGVAALDPSALVAKTDPVALVRLPPEEQGTTLTAGITAGLRAGPFTAPLASGEVTVAVGVVRSANLSLSGPKGTLFGDIELRLADLGLGGSFDVAPAPDAAPGILSAELARATLLLEGTLSAPVARFDLQSLVDLTLATALENEAARLEKLRAEEEAAKKEAAKAAAEVAAREAAAAEAARVAAEAAKPKPVLVPDLSEPIDLFGTGTE